MKRHTYSARSAIALSLSLAGGLAGLTALSATAAADDSGRSPATTRAYNRLLARFDANHDGVLQVTELPDPLRERLGRADADRDGVISVAELHAYGVARRAERFARADANGDGKLTASEVGAARWDWLKVADADGDGAVTLAEIERAVAAGTLRRPGDDGRDQDVP
jgi:hypothetical protein